MSKLGDTKSWHKHSKLWGTKSYLWHKSQKHEIRSDNYDTKCQNDKILSHIYGIKSQKHEMASHNLTNLKIQRYQVIIMA